MQWATVCCLKNSKTQSYKNITPLQASHQATGYYQFPLDPTDNLLSHQSQQKIALVILMSLLQVQQQMVWPKHAVYYSACNLWDPWGLDNEENKDGIGSFSMGK